MGRLVVDAALKKHRFPKEGRNPYVHRMLKFVRIIDSNSYWSMFTLIIWSPLYFTPFESWNISILHVEILYLI